MALRGQREVGQFGGAFGNARQHGVTMRNGFVARRRDTPRDHVCRMNRFFAQGGSLAKFRSELKKIDSLSRNFSTLAAEFPSRNCPAGQFGARTLRQSR